MLPKSGRCEVFPTHEGDLDHKVDLKFLPDMF
jgi:hypothetical protein